MTIESICIEQQDIIAKQSAVIIGLLEEIALHRALRDDEEALLLNCKGEQHEYMANDSDLHRGRRLFDIRPVPNNPPR